MADNYLAHDIQLTRVQHGVNVNDVMYGVDVFRLEHDARLLLGSYTDAKLTEAMAWATDRIDADIKLGGMAQDKERNPRGDTDTSEWMSHDTMRAVHAASESTSVHMSEAVSPCG